MSQATSPASSPARALGSPEQPRRWGLWITVFVLTALTSTLTWRGFDYYTQSLSARALHPEYRLLNPAGFLGHGYGMVGTAMILTNLLYLVRRRFAKILPNWVGSMKAWLNAHAFTGLTGSVLILFHSAFQLRTPIATVTSASLAIVVVTGLVGLYLYELVPKAGLKPLKDRLVEIEPLLPGVVKRIDAYVHGAPATTLPHDASFTRTIFTVPRWVLEAGARRRGVAAAAREEKLFRVLENTDPKLARAFLHELGDLAAAEIDTHAGAAIMRSWRSLHRFLALLMIASVTVHIAVAWYFGFRWIFSQ
jgi:hypothetical protein